MNTPRAGSAKNLVRAFALLRVLAEHGEGLTLTEVCRLGEVPKPTAHRLLGALEEAGMIKENRRGVYGLGPQCLVLGSAFLDGLDIRREAKGVLEDLVAKSGETCHLGIRDEDRVVYIEKVESPQMVQLRSRVGLTAPLHSSALGKTLLAHGKDADVEEIFAKGLERRTSNTITDLQRLRLELEEVRRCGFAVDDMENEDGIRCVAAPVFDHLGKNIASISVSGPEYRMPDTQIQQFGGLVREAALDLSRKIGYRYDAYNSEEVSQERDLV